MTGDLKPFTRRLTFAWIHAHVSAGVLPKGTPVAQCIPVKREAWTARTTTFTDEETQRAHALMGEIGRDRGVYRRRFRA